MRTQAPAGSPQDMYLLRWETRLSRYESMKQAWAHRNPQATPREYQDAIRRIARECKV